MYQSKLGNLTINSSYYANGQSYDTLPNELRSNPVLTVTLVAGKPHYLAKYSAESEKNNGVDFESGTKHITLVVPEPN